MNSHQKHIFGFVVFFDCELINSVYSTKYESQFIITILHLESFCSHANSLKCKIN